MENHFIYFSKGKVKYLNILEMRLQLETLFSEISIRHDCISSAAVKSRGNAILAQIKEPRVNPLEQRLGVMRC